MFASPATSWMSASPLEIMITRACEPSLPEPNYALHLEVAEYINTKKANTARDAAKLLVRLANHRNPHVGMLALALLDTLVQSCGYAFHLQLATKEFLNELVRRFPERPPPFPGPVMQRILDLIHTWKEGICSDSRWKSDLGNIRDMHRLLTFKGYRFRDTSRGTPSAASAANLKSAEELEEEDREAQSAKLQELIRRGTPRDLAAAQELMKSLAGANPDAKPDYRAQALTELNKLEQKVILLNELLDNFDAARNERFANGDAYDQVANILSSARPKIQKWISDAETDDPESLDTFLQINDQINTVLNRYDAFKRGDYVASSNPIPAELAGRSAQQPLSLIDFDDEAPGSPPAAGAGPADDLASLFGAPASQQPLPSGAPSNANGHGYGAQPLAAQLGSIMLPGTPGHPRGMSPTMGGMGAGMGGMGAGTGGFGAGMGGVSGMGMGAGASAGSGWGSAPMGMQHSGSGMQQQPPNYFGGARTATPVTAGIAAGASMGAFGAPQQRPAQQQPQQPVQQQPQQPQAGSGKDPFADLAGLF